MTPSSVFRADFPTCYYPVHIKKSLERVSRSAVYHAMIIKRIVIVGSGECALRNFGIAFGCGLEVVAFISATPSPVEGIPAFSSINAFLETSPVDMAFAVADDRPQSEFQALIDAGLEPRILINPFLPTSA